MIDYKNCYRKIGKSIVLKDYFENQNLSFQKYYGFDVSFVPLEIILAEPVLKEINDRYEISTGGIIRLDSNRCYKWHSDSNRGVSINLLLNPEIESLVLFGNSVFDSDDQYEILKFEYEKDTFYLFNTQMMHTVINFDLPRYLFTVEFKQDKSVLTFNNLLS